MTVLRVGRLKPSLEKTLDAEHQALVLPDGPSRTGFLAEHGPAVEVVVTSGLGGGVDADLIGALPKLGAIVNFGVGYDTIDVDAARARGVRVSNTPGVLDDCVADTAVGLVIDVMRGFSTSDRYARAGRWPVDGAFPLQRRVSGAPIGIVGLGRIGRAIATRLAAFGCPISYHNRHPVADVPYRYESGLVEMARAVRVLVVATAGGAETVKLIDRSVLAALGPEGYLVNVARGSVVDEDALVDLLLSGGLAGAGLDVYAHEPRIPEELFALDSVVLLPHLASGTVETRAAMEALVLENLTSWLTQGRLVTEI